MKRKISIYIIVLLIVLVIFGFWYGFRKQQEERTLPKPQVSTETETTILASTPEAVTYAYIVGVEDGNLVVYLGDGQTVYMETGIRMENLEDALQEKVQNGIGFRTAESLYDFLENYAS